MSSTSISSWSPQGCRSEMATRDIERTVVWSTAGTGGTGCILHPSPPGPHRAVGQSWQQEILTELWCGPLHELEGLDVFYVHLLLVSTGL